jgi:hypothetical protein
MARTPAEVVVTGTDPAGVLCAERIVMSCLLERERRTSVARRGRVREMWWVVALRYLASEG